MTKEYNRRGAAGVITHPSVRYQPEAASSSEPFPLVDYIIDFENGELDDDGVIELFQYLIDTGAAWTLQGSYGRMAAALIDAGHCTPKVTLPLTPGADRTLQPVPEPKPEKVGTTCECGAPYVYLEHLNSWGYRCAR